MLLKPNDLPPMNLGEKRNVMFKLSGAVGANAINSFSIESVPGSLSFGSPSIAGTNVTVRVNADALGDYTLVATAVLSSTEEVIGHVRVKVVEADSYGTRDYYRH